MCGRRAARSRATDAGPPHRRRGPQRRSKNAIAQTHDSEGVIDIDTQMLSLVPSNRFALVTANALATLNRLAPCGGRGG
jgi:hypothetical protein